MKKLLLLFFVMGSMAINAQHEMISEFVEAGDTLADLSDTLWVEVSQVGEINATKVIRLKPFFDGLQNEIDINAKQLADSLGWPNIIVNGRVEITGTVSGSSDLTLDTDPTVILDASDCKNKTRYNDDADVVDYTLPAAAKGLVVMFYDIAGGVITVDPVDGTDTIYLNGTSVGAGDEIDSPGEVGDFICLMAIDATRWITIGRSGTWVDANP